ncbi:MAG: response regulator [Gammaproteobacteria bacterium]|nr:MAG: response regulator [Gammaproteobacteria bacterium]
MNTTNAQTDPQQQPQQEMTLLFVDDEANILSSLRRVFRPLGYRIFIAQSGAEGLALMEQENIDLVISDMRMPEMDGAEFLQQVKQRWPDTMRILLTGYADLTSTIAVVNKGKIYSYISKPWEDNDIILQVKHALQQRELEQEGRRLELLTQKQNKELTELNSSLEAKVEERTEKLHQAMEELETANESLKKSYSASVKAFSSMAQVREGISPGHSRRVAELARQLAQQMGLDESGVQDVLFAGLLHDIGKITLSEEINNKPVHKLTPAERAEYKKHPVVGAAMLMALEPLHESATMIRSHHENYDGKGFPDGLKFDQIPLGARILAVVNAYDDLRSGSLWSKRHTMNEAVDYLVKHRCQDFDPKVVDAFCEFVGLEEEEVDETLMQVSTDKLESGMIIAQDIHTENGVLLLSKGHILDAHIIAKIRELERNTGNKFEITIKTWKMKT